MYTVIRVVCAGGENSKECMKQAC